MLILQRKEGESLLIGEDVEITVMAVEAGRVRLAIQAPRSVTILRSELKVAAQANREAADEQGLPLFALENQHVASSFRPKSARRWCIW